MKGWEQGVAAAILGVMITVFIVLLLLLGYLLCRAVNLVLRVLVRYPHAAKPLWLALLVLVATVVLAAITTFVPLAACAGAIFLVVVLVARGIELAHTEAFEDQPSFAGLVDDVLHNWWTDVAV